MGVGRGEPWIQSVIGAMTQTLLWGSRQKPRPSKVRRRAFIGENHAPGMVPEHPELWVPGLVGGWRPPDTEYMCPAGVARALHMLLTGWEIFDSVPCPSGLVAQTWRPFISSTSSQEMPKARAGQEELDPSSHLLFTYNVVSLFK